MKKTFIFIIIFLFSYLSKLSAQIGTWTMYRSYYNITEIAPAKETAFALASGSLFSYNIKDGSIKTYDKSNYLSDVDISHIRYNPTCKKLIITYSNSNIDLLGLDVMLTISLTSISILRQVIKISTIYTVMGNMLIFLQV